MCCVSQLDQESVILVKNNIRSLHRNTWSTKLNVEAIQKHNVKIEHFTLFKSNFEKEESESTRSRIWKV